VALLLERERELAELAAARTEAASGCGGAVAITADAGLGKTRLLRQAQREGGAMGFEVLTARATELERDFPFALVRQLFGPHLRGLSPEQRQVLLEGSDAARGALGLDPSPNGTHDSFVVLHGLYWVTAALAEQKPLQLAIDDLQWADPSSIDYVTFLLPRLNELPIHLVLTSRTDESEPAENLGRILADTSVRSLNPMPLSADATAALLTEELGGQPENTFAQACHEVSGGNPFLLSELIRTLADMKIEPVDEQVESVREQAPERVAQSVWGRIAKLMPPAGAMARSLAVIGDDTEPQIAFELAGLDPKLGERAMDELRAAAIFGPDSGARFIHPLVRNAVYTGIAPGDRFRLHHEAAALLREHGASAERIATQLLASEPRGERQSVEDLVEAGEQALANGAPRSAIAYLSRARAEPPSEELRAAVLTPLLTAAFRAADQSVLPAVESEVLAAWARDPVLRGRWALPLTMLMALSGRFDETASLLQDAVETAIAEGDVERVFQFKAQLSTLASVVPSIQEVEVGDYADIPPDSPTGRLAAAMEARSKMVEGSAAEAAAAARRALSQDGAIFAEEPELAAPVLSVMMLVAADDMEAARHGAECALRIAAERGATPDLARARFLNGIVAFGHGDLVAAEADMRQAVELARLGGIVPLVLLFTGPFLEVLIERDELDTAEAELAAIGLAAGPMPEGSLFAMLLLFRAHLRVEQGRFEEAVEDCVTTWAEADSVGAGGGSRAMAGPFAVRAFMATGEPDQARELVDRIVPEARRWRTPFISAHVLRAAAGLEKGEKGIELLQKAVAQMEGTPRHLERMHVLIDLGAALRAAGRRAEARGPLREGFELARRRGAARAARRAHDELEATGETVRRYTPIGVESLTPSERRVADLAASGMTNRQIAQTLFVTIKTVEAHLSAAYHKLDIRSRRELGTALAVGGDAGST
jgi:DNA-binding CsgD family transcriptional regulator